MTTGAHLLRQRAPDHLPHRVAQRREQGEDRCRFEDARTGPDHDQDADESRDDGQPAVQPHAFAEERARQPGDEEGHGEVDRHRIGDGDRRNGQHEAEIGQAQDEAAHEDQAEGRRREQLAQRLLAPDEDAEDRDGPDAAQHQRLVDGIAAGDRLDDGVLGRGEADARKDAGDREKAVVVMGGGGHDGCT